jgi:hypothetical protein
MWTPEGIRPIVTVTGSHQKTCVFGTITIDGKQLFRQYDVFNQYAFLNYLKELQSVTDIRNSNTSDTLFSILCRDLKFCVYYTSIQAPSIIDVIAITVFSCTNAVSSLIAHKSMYSTSCALIVTAYNNGILEIAFKKKVQPKGKTIQVE